MKKFQLSALAQNIELAQAIINNTHSMKLYKNGDGTFMVLDSEIKKSCTPIAANNIIWCKNNGTIFPSVMPSELKEAAQKVVADNLSAKVKENVDNIKHFAEDVLEVPKIASLKCNYADERLEVIVDDTCIGSISSASSRNIEWATHIFNQVNFRQQVEELLEGTPMSVETFSLTTDFAINGTDLNTLCVTTEDDRQAFMRKVKSAIEKSGDLEANQKWAKDKLDALGIEYELTVGVTTYSLYAYVEGASIYKDGDAIRNMKSVINRYIAQVEKATA